MPDVIHIAGLLLHVHPDQLDAVIEWLDTRGVQRLVRAAVPGKCAVVIECTSEREIGRYIDEIHAQAGVISVAMTSHYIEPVASLEEVNE